MNRYEEHNESWTEKEIADYKRMQNTSLRELYAERGLEDAGPGERAYFLMQDYLDPMSLTDINLVNGMSALKGRVRGMHLLEKLAEVELAKRAKTI